MFKAFSARARRTAAALAALVVMVAISSVTFYGTASADPVAAAGYPPPYCETGTGANGDNPTSLRYAWARCKETDSNPNITLWDFQVVWSCTSDPDLHYGPWGTANNQTLRGYCPRGKSVDISSVNTNLSEV
jgi:hypothetical protein